MQFGDDYPSETTHQLGSRNTRITREVLCVFALIRSTHVSCFFGTYSKMKAGVLILKMFNKTFMHSDLKKTNDIISNGKINQKYKIKYLSDLISASFIISDNSFILGSWMVKEWKKNLFIFDCLLRKYDWIFFFKCRNKNTFDFIC